MYYDYYDLLHHTLSENTFGYILKEKIGDLSKIKQVMRQFCGNKKCKHGGSRKFFYPVLKEEGVEVEGRLPIWGTALKEGEEADLCSQDQES